MISLISMSYLSFFPVFNIEFYYFYRKQPVIPAKKKYLRFYKRHIMDSKELTVEEKIVQMLKTVYDPEIPVNVFDLGLIYKVDVEDGNVKIDMTLTAPNCPAADFIVEDVRMKVESIDEIKSVDIQLVFEPEGDKDMMSEEAKLELGFL